MLTFPQANLIAHSLGIRLQERVLSHLLKDKKLPEDFYRNFFEISKLNNSYGRTIEELVKLKLMEKHTAYETVYFVTDLGIAEFRTYFASKAIYLKHGTLDVSYLSHLINFYCEICNYNFCSDNSSHIFEYYVKHHVKGHRVSHTTLDVIKKFSKELRKYRKAGLLDTFEI